MTRIEAAGGVVFRMDRGVCSILLILRRGVWDLPKGKRDPGESRERCAVREVQEETGAEPVRILDLLQTTRHTYKEKDALIDKETWWYAMEYSGDLHELHPETEEQIEAIAWVPIQEAITRVAFENLKEVLHTFTKKGYCP